MNDKLSARDQELLSMVFHCLESEPKVWAYFTAYAPDVADDAVQVNIQKFASMAGFTNPGSASNAWRDIRKKLGIDGAKGDGDERPPKTPATTTTPGKKRKATTKGSTDDASPTKKSRGRTKEDVNLDSEDEADVEEGAQTGAQD